MKRSALFFVLLAALGALAPTSAFAQQVIRCQSSEQTPVVVSGQWTCVAVGSNATAVESGTAVGDGAAASGQSSTATGLSAQATGDESVATGAFSNAAGVLATAIGSRAIAAGDQSIALGTSADASDQFAIAIGPTSSASAQSSIAVGQNANSSGRIAVAVGDNSNATQEGAVAIGGASDATGRASTAIGQGAQANVDGCVALGSGSQCNEVSTVAVGNRRITDVEAGIDPGDAANMSQVGAVAGSLGAGAAFNNGAYTPPNYVFLSGAAYQSVDMALYDLDGRVYNLENNPPGQGPAGADGRSAYEVAVSNGFQGNETQWLESLQGANGQDGQDGSGGGSEVVAGENIEVTTNEDGTQTVGVADNIELSDQGSLQVGATTVNGNGVSIEGGPSVTRNGIDAGNQRVTNVAPGRIEQGSMDAVNGGQIWELEDRWNDRWSEMDNRMDTIGAQSAALTMMAAAGSPNGLAVGEVAINAAPGFYGNKVAFAIGFSSRLSEKVSMSGGLSLAPNGKAMGGVGFSIRLGR